MSTPNSSPNSSPNPSSNSKEKQLLIRQLKQCVTRWRRQFLVQKVLMLLPTMLALAFTLLFVLVSLSELSETNVIATSLTINTAAVISIALLFIGLLTRLMLTLRSETYQNITFSNLISYLNQHFSELEDSAQLLLVEASQLSALEKLQHHKVQSHLAAILKQQSQIYYIDLSPKFAKKKYLYSCIIVVLWLLILILANNLQWFAKANAWLDTSSTVSAIEDTHIEDINLERQHDNVLVDIVSQQVFIEPPPYSLSKNQAASTVSTSLDIDTLEGSYISWAFTFSAPALNYFIVFSSGERQQLIKQEDGRYYFRGKVTTSMVYHLAAESAESIENKLSAMELSKKFSTIYRISLTSDQAPKIRFINPKSTVTEYGKNTTPSLSAEVLISDDFALAEVEILASIAKGSGEGVKFRDQRFSFDRTEIIDGKQYYYKSWSLMELDMEPGDELYFTVVAYDNRQPERQQTRSTTKIIRWLEEEQTGINADGVLLDFMPEYFKSQRQIIIETIELIEDEAGLERTEFNHKSQSLGNAQSALKEKYGQFLGDEFEGQHNVDATFDESFDESQSADEQHRPEIQVHDEAGGSSNAVINISDEQHQETAEHEHASDRQSTSNNDDLSGRMTIINRYGHNHEDSDVGMMNSQDPRALMKKSLANMWQAELHLMLSEPALALPFEQQALRLLNLAKKAERIYVKRLGFEPPPVTEQRRYQGEQTDILTKAIAVSRFKPAQLSNQTQLAFTKLLRLLNKVNHPILTDEFRDEFTDDVTDKVTDNLNYKITDKAKSVEGATMKIALKPEELTLVKDVKAGVEKLIDKRPALVEVLAVLEQILLERKFNLSQCDNCLVLLAGKLEQLIPNAVAAPSGKAQDFYDQQPLIERYSQFLEGNL
ncbi:hypothetical protein EKO29_09290 [Colwellia sp. Arc7-635]|uniref:hypothetical protein n=1 Tax=Colwellia sp. Arc7-635 TaxID=2497879 RepID=UPI000F850F5C|nr:hypothetical protein [Colwellia sp. Arc7-635]AZQ84198.1 hypothetical protein EKO29_09290 [Colwellia sp. Arc7-635]